MKVHRPLKTILSGLVLASIVASSTRLLGDDLPTRLRGSEAPTAVRKLPGHEWAEWKREVNQAHVPPTLDHSPTAKPSVSDIALDKQGDFCGTIVDNFGLPRQGVLVVAQRAKEQPRTARTNAKGDFRIAGMKGGNWIVTVDRKASLVRAWNRNIAPPAAKPKFLAVSNPSVIRGQSGDEGLMAAFDTGTLFSAGAGIAGITLGVIGISEASEANDEADALQNQLDALSTQLSDLQMTVDDIAATLN